MRQLFLFAPLYFVDEEAPKVFCADDQSIETDNGKPAAVVEWAEVTARDNSGNVSRLVCDRQSGTNFAIGETTITCQAFDQSGNRAECSFQVMVIGNCFMERYCFLCSMFLGRETPKFSYCF